MKSVGLQEREPLGEEGLLEFTREKGSLDKVVYQRVFMVFVLFLVVKSLLPIFISFVVSRKECVLKLKSMLKSKEGLLLKSAPLFLIHLSTWYRSVLFTCWRLRRQWRLGAHGPGGCYRNYTSRRKNTHRHANLRPAPHYSTRHTAARSPVEIKCTNPRNKEKKSREGGGDLKPRRGGREGNQEKPYATRTPRHANKASSTTQTKRRRMACACATATYRWTGICPHANEQW